MKNIKLIMLVTGMFLLSMIFYPVMGRTNENYNETQDNFLDSVKTLSKGVKKLKDKLNETTMIIGVKEAAITRLEKEKKTIEGDLQALLKKFEKIKSSIPEKIAFSQKPLEEEIRSLKDQLRVEKKNFYQKMEKNNLSSQKKIESLKKQLMSFGTNAEKKEMSIKTLSRQIKSLQKQLLLENKQKIDLKLAFKKSEQQLKMMEETIFKKVAAGKIPLEKKILELTAKGSATEKSFQMSIEEGQKSLKNKIQELTNRLKATEALVKNKESLNGKLKEQKQLLVNEISRIRHERDTLQKSVSELIDRLKGTQEKFSEQKKTADKKVGLLRKDALVKDKILDELKKEVKASLKIISTGP